MRQLISGLAKPVLATLLSVGLFFSAPLAAQEEMESAAQSVDDQTADDLPLNDEISQEQIDEYLAWAEEFEAGLDHKTGEITLADGEIKLNIADTYYYLDKADSRAVLEEAWGNPPNTNVLGMIFPAAYSPLDEDSWGVALYMQKDGYVSDKDAAKIDYAKLMKDMQRDQRSENKYRTQQGYPTIELIGWAEDPVYDPEHNRMYWAQDMIFEGSDVHTLNYDMRVLGRRGVLTLSYIATMDQLEEIRATRDEILSMAAYNEGSRYADFQQGDKVAEYGLAALVVGGAGLAVAKKAGFLGIVFLFLKKAGIFILAGLGGLFAWIKRKFSGEA